MTIISKLQGKVVLGYSFLAVIPDPTMKFVMKFFLRFDIP